MSVYDLVRALGRYKWAVLTSFVVLFAVVAAMTFKLEDGKPTWRAAAKYDSSVQIAVIPPGIDSLTTASIRSGEMYDAAVLYRALLGTDEAALFIGKAAGYRLEEPVRATVDSDAALITAAVYGPTPEQSQAAALATFDYLEQKLQIPLDVADLPEPTETVVVLDGPFESTLVLTVDDSFSAVDSDLFLIIDSGMDNPTTLPVASTAGQTFGSRATLAPVMALTLTLQNDEQGVLDTVRVAPPAPEATVARAPELELRLLEGAIVETGADPDGEDPPWELDSSRVSVSWREPDASIIDQAPIAGQDVQIALLTPEPGWLSVGGRRGPIALVAALIVGTVLILSAIIITDAWRRERERGLDAAEDDSVVEAWPKEATVVAATQDEEAPVQPVTGPEEEAAADSPWSYVIATAANRAKRSEKKPSSDDASEAEDAWRRLG
jgi:hypothetical protein